MPDISKQWNSTAPSRRPPPQNDFNGDSRTRGHKKMTETIPSIGVGRQGHVATIALNRPPHNFLDLPFVRELADAFDALSKDDTCRAIVLRSSGKTFCAGADFGAVPQDEAAPDPAPFYAQAMRLFEGCKPLVAAIGGPAIGAGLGLALACDFRVATASARFSANFCRLGFHPGFGMSLTLPRLVGQQQAARLFYTGRRIGGEEAARIGLVDELVDDDALLDAASQLAQDIADSAPLAVASTRATLRGALATDVALANRHELAQQRRQFATADFREGVAAMAVRRLPRFVGR